MISIAPIEYVDHPCFGDAEMSGDWTENGPVAETTASEVLLFAGQLLEPEEERRSFLLMNWLKWKAARLLEHDGGRGKEEVDKLLGHALRIRNAIVLANERLIVPVARRFGSRRVTFEELVSEGQPALIRAVELFDCSKGWRFSTYATHAIRNACSRYVQRQRKEFRKMTTCEQLTVDAEVQTDTSTETAVVSKGVAGLLQRLSGRDRELVTMRWGLAGGAKPMSHASIGREVGLSKERVRQRVMRALDIMREAADPEVRELMGVES